MKKYRQFKALTVSAMLIIFAASSHAEESAPATSLEHDMGYFFGYSFGNILKEGGNESVDMDGVMAGMKDSLARKFPALTQEQQQAVIAVVQANQNKIQQARVEAESAAAEEGLAAASAFLEQNGSRDGISTTASGLQYQVLQAGSGDKPAASDTVRVHYEGKLVDGSVFDSSYKRGEPAEFGLNQVIPGWTEGLQLIAPGGKIRLYIPPELAYGSGGTRGIPPNSVLIFDVELLEVK